MYSIENEIYNGPLDLLLKLIEDNKLDITQISLSKITDSYLEDIRKIEGTPEDLAEFVFIATRLLYLKSKELLPDTFNEEDELEIKNLEKDLIEYQKYKNAAEALSHILEKNERAFSRKKRLGKIHSFTPPKDINKERLWTIFNEVISKVEAEQIEKKAYERVRISLSETKENIKQIIKTTKEVTFKQIISKSNRIEIIVSFLAVLELIKQKEIYFKQNNNFSDFIIFRVK